MLSFLFHFIPVILLFFSEFSLLIGCRQTNTSKEAALFSFELTQPSPITVTGGSASSLSGHMAPQASSASSVVTSGPVYDLIARDCGACGPNWVTLLLSIVQTEDFWWNRAVHGESSILTHSTQARFPNHSREVCEFVVGRLLFITLLKKQCQRIVDLASWTEALIIFTLILTYFPHQWEDLTL